MMTASNTIIKGLLVLLAFTIQIQITLFKSADYIGLRVNITDLLLPLIGLFIVFSLFTKKTLWPQFPIKGMYFWLIGLGLILIAALLNSYASFNELSTWGIQNKIIGWAVICGLFLMGAWLGQNALKKDCLLFFTVLSSFLLLIILIQIGFQIAFFSFAYRPINNSFTNYPMEVFMANKNAFVFLFMVILGFLTSLEKHTKSLRTLTYAFWFLLPFIFIYTGARSAFMAFPFLFLGLIIFNKQAPWRKILAILTVGILLCVLLSKFSSIEIYTFRPHTIESLSHINDIVAGNEINKVADQLAYHGDSNRLNILHHVFGMIKENPLIGSGLGSVLITQVRDNGAYIDLMDCTILWLWAETGLIGLSFFLLFYLLCVRALWKKTKSPNDNGFTDDFCRAALMMMLTFGIMSLFHELLYTRFLWVFLGMALTLPIAKKS